MTNVVFLLMLPAIMGLARAPWWAPAIVAVGLQAFESASLHSLGINGFDAMAARYLLIKVVAVYLAFGITLGLARLFRALSAQLLRGGSIKPNRGS